MLTWMANVDGIYEKSVKTDDRSNPQMIAFPFKYLVRFTFFVNVMSTGLFLRAAAEDSGCYLVLGMSEQT